MSDEVIKLTNNSLPLTLGYADKEMYLKFNGSCLIKKEKFTFDSIKTVIIYIVYDIDSNLNNFDPIFQNWLFWAIKLTKHSDTDKYEYSGYAIGFDGKWVFFTTKWCFS